MVFADYNYNGVLDAGEPSAIADAATGAYSLIVDTKGFALVGRALNGKALLSPAGGVYYFEVKSGVPRTWRASPDFGIA